MLGLRLLILFILLGTQLAFATEGSRVRFRASSDGLRLNFMRFSDDGMAHVTNGEIKEGRFFPKQNLSVTILGAQDCQSVLDSVQRFPLEGMLKAKYITEDVFRALKSSADYLEASRVSFANVYSVVPRANFDAARDQFLDSQIALAAEAILKDTLTPELCSQHRERIFQAKECQGRNPQKNICLEQRIVFTAPLRSR